MYKRQGFILQGNTGHEAVVNTDTTWVCLRNKAYAPWTEWQVLGYYVAGPGEELEASAYPWGWEQPDYDDRKWEKAVRGMEGATKGSRDYPGRLLLSLIHSLSRRPIIIALIAILVVLIGGGGFWVYRLAWAPNFKPDKTVYVYIDDKKDFDDLYRHRPVSYTHLPYPDSHK